MIIVNEKLAKIKSTFIDYFKDLKDRRTFTFQMNQSLNVNSNFKNFFSRAWLKNDCNSCSNPSSLH